MSLNQRIKALIKSEKLTQKELADELEWGDDKGQSRVSYTINTAEKSSIIQIVMLLKKKTNVSFDWLFTDKGEMIESDQEPIQTSADQSEIVQLQKEVATNRKTIKQMGQEFKDFMKTVREVESRNRKSGI